MTAKLVKSASNDGQITKSELSDGRRAKLLPSVAESPYDWLQFEDYLGNVGLDEALLRRAALSWGQNRLYLLSCTWWFLLRHRRCA